MCGRAAARIAAAPLDGVFCGGSCGGGGLGGVPPQVGVAAAEKRRWLELPSGEALGVALRDKWLVEYPTVHVVLPGGEGAFPVADSAGPDAPPAANRWLTLPE